jgi:hypothetical protein
MNAGFSQTVTLMLIEMNACFMIHLRYQRTHRRNVGTRCEPAGCAFACHRKSPWQKGWLQHRNSRTPREAHRGKGDL